MHCMLMEHHLSCKTQAVYVVMHKHPANERYNQHLCRIPAKLDTSPCHLDHPEQHLSS